MKSFWKRVFPFNQAFPELGQWLMTFLNKWISGYRQILAGWIENLEERYVFFTAGRSFHIELRVFWCQISVNLFSNISQFMLCHSWWQKAQNKHNNALYTYNIYTPSEIKIKINQIKIKDSDIDSTMHISSYHIGIETHCGLGWFSVLESVLYSESVIPTNNNTLTF